MYFTPFRQAIPPYSYIKYMSYYLPPLMDTMTDDLIPSWTPWPHASVFLQVRATIFLVNNNGYTIEVQIHDGPYNDIKCWDYAGLMNCFNASEVGHRLDVLL